MEPYDLADRKGRVIALYQARLAVRGTKCCISLRIKSEVSALSRMPWRNDKRLMELLELANRKGYLFTKALLRDHVRLTDPEGRRVVKDGGSSAFSYTEAQRFLEQFPDK